MSREERSKRMSLIRSKWTKPEREIHNYLKGMKIRHEMHPKMEGNPDVLLKGSKTVIFVHGCFWHGCKKCCRKMPKTNKVFWRTKIKRNKTREKEIIRRLRKRGFRTVRLWEHEINKDLRVSIEKAVGRNGKIYSFN